MQQDPMKILQKQHNPPSQVHYHLHFYVLSHPVKLMTCIDYIQAMRPKKKNPSFGGNLESTLSAACE